MHVLVIEDELSLRNTTAQAIVSCGYEVDSAENGIEALARVDERQPDLVILDLQMPEMDGWEFLREFRARESCRATPVIITSAICPRAAPADAQAFFEKPFDLDELLDAVERLLPRETAPRAFAWP